MNMYGYIYITTNIINNKKYIGKHKAKIHSKSYLGSGVILNEAIKKYGRSNFTNKVIEWCNSLDELNEREIYWIKYYNAVNSDDFYNISPGGDGYAWNEGKTKYTNSSLMTVSLKESETKKRLYAEGKLKAWNKGLTKETSDAIAKYSKSFSKSKKGSKWSDIRRAAQPDQHGKNNPNYGHYWKDEMKKAQSEKLSGKRPYNAKYVRCVECDIIFNTLSEIEELLKIDRKKVSKCCKGEMNTYMGYHWEYVE